MFNAHKLLMEKTHLRQIWCHPLPCSRPPRGALFSSHFALGTLAHHSRKYFRNLVTMRNTDRINHSELDITEICEGLILNHPHMTLPISVTLMGGVVMIYESNVKRIHDESFISLGGLTNCFSSSLEMELQASEIEAIGDLPNTQTRCKAVGQPIDDYAKMPQTVDGYLEMDHSVSISMVIDELLSKGSRMSRFQPSGAAWITLSDDHLSEIPKDVCSKKRKRRQAKVTPLQPIHDEGRIIPLPSPPHPPDQDQDNPQPIHDYEGRIISLSYHVHPPEQQDMEVQGMEQQDMEVPKKVKRRFQPPSATNKHLLENPKNLYSKNRKRRRPKVSPPQAIRCIIPVNTLLPSPPHSAMDNPSEGGSLRRLPGPSTSRTVRLYPQDGVSADQPEPDGGSPKRSPSPSTSRTVGLYPQDNALEDDRSEAEPDVLELSPGRSGSLDHVEEDAPFDEQNRVFENGLTLDFENRKAAEPKSGDP